MARPPSISLVIRHNNTPEARPNPLVVQITPEDALLILDALTSINPASAEMRERRNNMATHFAILSAQKPQIQG